MRIRGHNPHVHIIRRPEEKKGIENIFKAIMAENFRSVRPNEPQIG